MPRRAGANALPIIFVTVLLDMLGIGIIVPVIPSLIENLAGRGLSNASVIGGYLFMAYSAMQFLWGPVIGNLSDAHGRRPVLLLSIFGLGPAQHVEFNKARNRFKVIKGEEKAFEDLWLSRESHLDTVPGFVEFHMLRGPERDDHVLYSSHTIWANRDAFSAWTTSEQFRAAHRGAGGTKPMYLGHPEFEGFEVIQTVKATKGKAAA